MRIRVILLAAAIAALPTAASARSVLSPGELSVAAELVSDLAVRETEKVSPSAGFQVRYAFSHDFAAFGELAFFHRFQDGEDPPAFYAIGGGIQWVPFSSPLASVFLRGGAQFIPRAGSGGQVLGFRLYAGPGVEARLTDSFSLQFFTALTDLQIGGESTDFDIQVLPSVGGFLYF